MPWPGTKLATARRQQPAVRIGLGYVKGINESEMEKLVAERDRGGGAWRPGDPPPATRAKRSRAAGWAGAPVRSLPRGERVAGLWSVGPRRTGCRGPAGGNLRCRSVRRRPRNSRNRRTGRGSSAEYGSIGMTWRDIRWSWPVVNWPKACCHDRRRLPAGSQLVEVAGLQVARQRPETAHGVIFILIEDEHGTST